MKRVELIRRFQDNFSHTAKKRNMRGYEGALSVLALELNTLPDDIMPKDRESIKSRISTLLASKNPEFAQLAKETFADIGLSGRGQDLIGPFPDMPTSEERKARRDKPPAGDKSGKRPSMSKSERTAIFNETLRIAKGESYKLPDGSEQRLDAALTARMISESVWYEADKIPDGRLKPSLYNTELEILPLDTIAVARAQKEEGLNPAVLNMANSYSAGGGVKRGEKAQEEDLARRTNVYLSQVPFTAPGKGIDEGRDMYNVPLPSFGGLFSPHAQAFRGPESDDFPFEKPFSFAMISLAGFDLGKIVQKENMSKEEKEIQEALKVFDAACNPGIDATGKPIPFDQAAANRAGSNLMRAFSEGTKQKIRAILNIALAQGRDSVVLGALSCGAFGLRGYPELMAETVAECYQTVLKEYAGRFKKISFGILVPTTQKDKVPTEQEKNNDINFSTFNRKLRNLDLSKQSSQAASAAAPAAAPQAPSYTTQDYLVSLLQDNPEEISPAILHGAEDYFKDRAKPQPGSEPKAAKPAEPTPDKTDLKPTAGKTDAKPTPGKADLKPSDESQAIFDAFKKSNGWDTLQMMGAGISEQQAKTIFNELLTQQTSPTLDKAPRLAKNMLEAHYQEWQKTHQTKPPAPAATSAAPAAAPASKPAAATAPSASTAQKPVQPTPDGKADLKSDEKIMSESQAILDALKMTPEWDTIIDPMIMLGILSATLIKDIFAELLTQQKSPTLRNFDDLTRETLERHYEEYKKDSQAKPPAAAILLSKTMGAASASTDAQSRINLLFEAFCELSPSRLQHQIGDFKNEDITQGLKTAIGVGLQKDKWELALPPADFEQSIQQCIKEARSKRTKIAVVNKDDDESLKRFSKIISGQFSEACKIVNRKLKP